MIVCLAVLNVFYMPVFLCVIETGSSMVCDRREHSGYGRHGFHEGESSVHILLVTNQVTRGQIYLTKFKVCVFES